MLLKAPDIELDAVPDCGPLGESITPPSCRQPIDEVSDPLISLADWEVPTLDAYAILGILPPRNLMARGQAAVRLQAVRNALPEGFDIVVLDAYRTLAEQKALVDFYKAPSEFVASVSPESMRPPHTTGGAMNLTLSWDGEPLAIGTDYDAFEAAATLEAFESKSDDVIRRLRRLMANSMMRYGFARYSPEWWHWSYGDDVWAAATGRSALYEIVESHAHDYLSAS